MGLQEDRIVLKLLREKRKAKTMRERSNGLLMTDKEWEQYQATHCQGCGGTKDNPKPWFGEMFCGECVEAFKHGKKK